MNAAMTIEDFNAFMASEQEENSLLKFLRKLTAIEKPEDVRMLARKPVGPAVYWVGWGF